KTHGKDRAQSTVRLDADGGAGRFLLVTTLRFAPPERDGKATTIPIVPDVLAEPFAFSPADDEEVLEIKSARGFENYLALHAAGDGGALSALAKDDGGKFDAYPGFDAWARGLGSTITLGSLRRALRSEVRSWAIRQFGAVLKTDLRDDAPLRKA